MKKLFLVLLMFGLMVGCTSKETSSEDKYIKVVAQAAPMTDIVEIAKEEAAKDGYTIELMVVNDNIQYNVAVNTKEADASFAQHKPFMEQFNQDNNANLVALQPIYNAIVGFYSKHYQSVDEIENGATVAIPSDPTNEARALNILAEAGLIELKSGVGTKATVDDITANPHEFEFMKVSLLTLSEAYEEDNVAMVFNYPTYIAKVGLTTDDLILTEKRKDDFAIQVVAREDNKDSEKIQALIKYMTSDAVKQFLEENYASSSYPMFD